MNTPVIVAGFWYVDKDIETVSNDFRVSRTFGAHTLTAGNYFAYHSIQDLWYQGNNALLAFEKHARRIDVGLNNGVHITKDGFTGYATNHFVDDFDGRNLAFFLADDWEITDRLRVDGGVRYEDYKTDGTVGLATNRNLDGNLLTFYNNSVSVQNGTSQHFAYDDAKTSFTFGANYRLAPELSTFVRVNSGYRFPTFDEVRQGSRVVQEVDQYELGLKTAFDTLDVESHLFYNEFRRSDLHAADRRFGHRRDQQSGGGRRPRGLWRRAGRRGNRSTGCRSASISPTSTPNTPASATARPLACRMATKWLASRASRRACRRATAFRWPSAI